MIVEDVISSTSQCITPMHGQMMSGDEAVAAASLDAGIRFSAAYPGTPATDIQEALDRMAQPGQVRCVWSVNEKVAYESSLAAAIAGQRALVSMKHVGVNVASDAFINSCIAGVNAGLVLAIGDDPECHSSQNKQDSRMYRPLAGTVLLEPMDAQEAYSMTREAYRISEQFHIPVMLRLTTRTAYATTNVVRQSPDQAVLDINWPKDPKRFFIVPSVTRRLSAERAALQSAFSSLIAASSFSRSRRTDSGIGKQCIICAGIGAVFAYEYAPPDRDILKIAGEPFPEELIKTFIQEHSSLAVLEEGDPVIENRVRALAAGIEVRGRLSGHLKLTGELVPAEVDALLNEKLVPRPESKELPARLPEICKPCGYHKVFGALKEIQGIATPSDIGCNALGGLPPYSVMDGIWSMGSSIGVACGLAAIGHPRILAIIGDSTFFHSGIPPLIEAVHEGYRLTVLILDNGTTAMTGGQGVAHRIKPGSMQNSVDMTRLIESIGVTRCTSFDPHRLGKDGIRELVEGTFSEPGTKVLLYQSQCGIYSPGYHTEAPYALAKGGIDQ